MSESEAREGDNAPSELATKPESSSVSNDPAASTPAGSDNATGPAATTESSNPTTETPSGATDAASQSAATTESSSTSAEAKKPRKWSGYLWAAAIVVLLGAELFAYGHNGHIRVCVGRKGITDFTQLDKPRQGNAAAGFPFCVESLNLGMYSRSDDVAKEALDLACARAATLLRGEKSECLRRDKDWSRRVDKTTIPPWDPRLYRRLLFIE